MASLHPKTAPRESPHKTISSFSLSHSPENDEYNSLYVADFPSNISDKLRLTLLSDTFVSFIVLFQLSGFCPSPCKYRYFIYYPPSNWKLVTSCNSFSYLIPQTKPIKIFLFQAIRQPLSLIHCLYTLYPEESERADGCCCGTL